MSIKARLELESLIDKPRAFRNSSIISGKPLYRKMVFLGSDYPNAMETSKHHKKLIENRKYIKNEPLF